MFGIIVGVVFVVALGIYLWVLSLPGDASGDAAQDAAMRGFNGDLGGF